MFKIKNFIFRRQIEHAEQMKVLLEIASSLREIELCIDRNHRYGNAMGTTSVPRY